MVKNTNRSKATEVPILLSDICIKYLCRSLHHIRKVKIMVSYIYYVF